MTNEQTDENVTTGEKDDSAADTSSDITQTNGSASSRDQQSQKNTSEQTPDTPAEKKKTAEFSELKQKKVEPSAGNLNFILDIPLEVTVELGRTKMPIYDLLQLGQGSIVELNKLAGEPLEVRINQKLIARGEVVVVNEKFGIRLTDVVTPKERVEKLV